MSLQLSQLYIYPIKSLMGIRVKNAIVEQRGLQYDRRWMLVDTSNRFISQRQENQLVFLETAITDGQLIIKDRRSGETYSLPLEPELYKDKITVEIWEDTVKAYELSIEANEWFSDILDKDIKLVYMPEEVKRPVAPEWALGNEHVSFADELPLLIVGEASLQDLNSKLAEPVDIVRFRPNIVISGGDPYEEFFWKNLQIGEYEYHGLKPCDGCRTATINPVTGEIGEEPLLTLRQLQLKDKASFGQLALVKDPAGAVIREGDAVKILTKNTAHSENL
jgi:uncharacterized protein YcbX